MVYSDGQLIYIFSKIREQLKRKNHSIEESTAPLAGVYTTNNQLLGFCTIAVANLMSLLILQHWKANILLATYLVMAMIEHCVLESGKTH